MTGRPDLLELGLYFLAAFGLAYILGHSKISRPFREALQGKGLFCDWVLALIECPACLGFHIGWVYGLFRFDSIMWAVFLALATCASNLMLATNTRLIGDSEE